MPSLSAHHFPNFSLFCKYLLVKIIKPSFAASLGCIPNEPIPNHDLLPFLTLPIPGIKTSISNMKQLNIIRFDLL